MGIFTIRIQGEVSVEAEGLQEAKTRAGEHIKGLEADARERGCADCFFDSMGVWDRRHSTKPPVRPARPA